MKQATIKKLYPFVAAIAFIIMMMFSFSFTHTAKRQSINPVIGDVSFTKKFGYKPDATSNEDLRIRTHLAYVENLLRQKDVSDLSTELQLKRTHLLNLLHDYWSRGVFPRNYDYKNQHRPCFIDKDGRICAVGYLIEQTAGRKTAEVINVKHKYDRIVEMRDEMVANWINNSGLTKEECAMIQPSYGPPPCNGNKVWTCRISNCVTECKCVPVNNVAKWQANGHLCPGGNQRSFNEEFLFLSTEKPQKGSLKIFDMTGRLVKNNDTKFAEGIHEVNLNTNNMNPGIYLLRLESEGILQTRKFVVMK